MGAVFLFPFNVKTDHIVTTVQQKRERDERDKLFSDHNSPHCQECFSRSEKCFAKCLSSEFFGSMKDRNVKKLHLIKVVKSGHNKCPNPLGWSTFFGNSSSVKNDTTLELKIGLNFTSAVLRRRSLHYMLYYTGLFYSRFFYVSDFFALHYLSTANITLMHKLHSSL